MQNDKKIAVLHLISSLRRAGAEMVVVNLCNGLDREKFRIGICCLQDNTDLADTLHNPEEIYLKTCGLAKKLRPNTAIASIRKLRHHIREFQPDIIHSHLYSYTAPFEFLSTIGYPCKHVATIHHCDIHYRQQDTAGKIARFCERLNLRLTHSHCISISQVVRNMITGVLKIPDSKITTIYNGVDTEKWTPVAEKPDCRKILAGLGDHLNPSDPIVSCIARFNPIKNHEQLVRAWADVVKKIPNARLLLVGNGEKFEDIQKLANNLGVTKNVIFADTRNDIRDINSICDAGVLYSISEGLGVSAIETMAMGLPVIGSNVSGINEVTTQETGGLVPINQPHMLAEKIIEILSDKQKRLEMGKAARNRAIDIFSLKTQVKKHEQLYWDILNG